MYRLLLSYMNGLMMQCVMLDMDDNKYLYKVNLHVVFVFSPSMFAFSFFFSSLFVLCFYINGWHIFHIKFPAKQVVKLKEKRSFWRTMIQSGL